MAQSAVEGARSIARELQQDDQLDVMSKPANEATAQDLLAADAYLFCAPENLASLSGAMKEFFDRNYYDSLDKLNGRPYALIIAAGTDGRSAAQQAERICTGWRLRAIAPPLIVRNGAQTAQAILATKTVKPEDQAACATLGATLAAMLL